MISIVILSMIPARSELGKAGVTTTVLTHNQLLILKNKKYVQSYPVLIATKGAIS